MEPLRPRGKQSHEHAHPTGGSWANPRGSKLLLFLVLSQILLSTRLAHWCKCARVFPSQALNEVFAENLQFPHGLNLAKIAFLTLLGFNSNKPPLYYGTRSHCLDTARKIIHREGKRSREKEESREGGGKQGRQTNRSCSLHPGDSEAGEAAAGQQRGCRSGAFPQHPRAR